jgi:hypothetical protein
MSARSAEPVEVAVSIKVVDQETSVGIPGIGIEIGQYEHRGLLQLLSFAPLVRLVSDEGGNISAKIWLDRKAYLRLSGRRDQPSSCIFMHSTPSNTDFNRQEYADHEIEVTFVFHGCSAIPK